MLVSLVISLKIRNFAQMLDFLRKYAGLTLITMLSLFAFTHAADQRRGAEIEKL